jgi:hypothetical protein
MASSGAQLDARTTFFLATSVATVAGFFVWCIPPLGSTLRYATERSYKLGFLAAAAAQALRCAHLFAPKLRQLGAGSSPVAAAWAAAPTLGRELLASNAFLYFLHCLLFLFSRPTPLALVSPTMFAAVQAATTLHKTALGQRQAVKDGFAKLTAFLPQLCVSAATTQVMLGISLLISLVTSKREVAKTFVCVPRAAFRRAAVCSRALLLIPLAVSSVAVFPRALPLGC